MKSDATQVLSDVPQGTVLAPLLFLIYINDLPTSVHNKVRLYADDVFLYCYINSKDDCISPQQDLDALEKWSIVWQMFFNPSKCEFIRHKQEKPYILYLSYHRFSYQGSHNYQIPWSIS